jgi:LPXTG-site transpeptidase (sortase) family protein
VPNNAWEVAWYNFSAQPGTGGNAVFAGHVTWSGQAVFYRLNQLQTGDQVRLRGENGNELIYTVEQSFMVDPNDPAALGVMGPQDRDMITIITCDGAFYQTGGPLGGDYTHRRVVQATFTSANMVAGSGASG